MKYTGRILGLTLTILFIIAVRIYAYFYLNYPVTAPPLPGLIALTFAYWAGKKYDQVKFYSERDSLTGLYNRRMIDKLSATTFARSHKRREQVGLILFDCNNFKIINDTYGHNIGDLVLQAFARLLVKETRKNDVVARWGGDEFLVIVTNADEQQMKAILQRIELKTFELSKEFEFPISVASGFSLHVKESEDLDTLLAEADHMMYRQKRTTCYSIAT
ncbi:MAG: GGDEF domain-containing protein [Sporomusaceae bacterium]|nr:GGDEF domain-containing protein [Sporomusaceae bacterium]